MQWDPSMPSHAPPPVHASMHDPLFSTFSPTFSDGSLEPAPGLIDSYASMLDDHSPESWSSGSGEVPSLYMVDFDGVSKASPALSTPITPCSSKHNSTIGLGIIVPQDGFFGDLSPGLVRTPWGMEDVVRPSSQSAATPPTPSSLAGTRSKRTSREFESDRSDSQTTTATNTDTKTKRRSASSNPARLDPNSDAIPGGRSTKLAHNIVERNYRDRLNDQITELSAYLFDLSADSKCEYSRQLATSSSVCSLHSI
jgi:hypothetical protein